MRSGKRKFIRVLLGFLILAAAAYLAVAFYYRKGYSLNTWINGVYCTGKTVQEVNSELLSRIEAPIVTVSDREGASYELDLTAAGYTADFTEILDRFRQEQTPLLWAANIAVRRWHTLSPSVSYDSTALRAMWNELPCVSGEREREASLEIRMTPEGYELYDGRSARLDEEAGFLALKEALARGETSLDLEAAGVYRDLPQGPGEAAVMELWQKVERFQDCGIVYDMGDRLIPLKGKIAAGFLLRTSDGSFVLDGQGKLSIDLTAVSAFINSLEEEYNTYGKEREFHSTRGDVVTVKGGTYGTKLDAEAEEAYLIKALKEETSELHVPSYRKEGAVRGRDDIGDTYIEIDMTQQKMYYYQDGSCLVETDIVTGNTGRRMGTPEGVNYVYAKQKNRTLRGPGYASFVNFWMPVRGNIGIHDAGWRSKFGGEIYKKSGSHGCINTPYEQMKTLYELAEVGTPVILFY